MTGCRPLRREIEIIRLSCLAELFTTSAGVVFMLRDFTQRHIKTDLD